MKLRLYKTPYFDPMHPGVRRLLFEGKVAIDDRKLDFYIYVWITVDGVVQAFQAVLEDTITLAFQVPAKLSFGKISKEVVNRATNEQETSQERKKLVSVIGFMINDEFPDLLVFIKDVVTGNSVTEKHLNKKEMQLFSILCDSL